MRERVSTWAEWRVTLSDTLLDELKQLLGGSGELELTKIQQVITHAESKDRYS